MLFLRWGIRALYRGAGLLLALLFSGLASLRGTCLFMRCGASRGDQGCQSFWVCADHPSFSSLPTIPAGGPPTRVHSLAPF